MGLHVRRAVYIYPETLLMTLAPLAGTTNHPSPTLKMMTAMAQTMKIHLHGLTMTKMTGGRIKTLLNPISKIFRTSSASIPVGFITTHVTSHETRTELLASTFVLFSDVALYHIRMIICEEQTIQTGAKYPAVRR